MLSKENIRDIVVEAVREQARETSDGREFDEDTKLHAELGLKSLALAALVATLEHTLRVDPFADFVSITSIRTVGDLVAAYTTFAASERAI